jgi:two-component system response regulator MprA
VIEDEPDLRDLLRILLEMEGYHVVCAANGIEALARLEADPRAGVILLDLAMPVMDGFTFRMRMLADPQLARIPVILVSAIRPTGEPAAFLRPAAVVPKPVDPDVLLERVGALCGAGASGASGSQDIPSA